ncbi:MAG: deoxyguanosinetriphosphate triphosphohydrolase, partial [Paracoccus sp. (in: a-proteobacteria)]|nr:deoxyguanosinetriphosphate triphosphohydrolase [Paracoccus sp. (in: a-proteobacteria)]
MYRAPEVMEDRAQVTRMLNAVFPLFLSDPSALPEDWREDVRAAPDRTEAARIVLDYMAGMTDRYATAEYRRLFG